MHKLNYNEIGCLASAVKDIKESREIAKDLIVKGIEIIERTNRIQKDLEDKIDRLACRRNAHKSDPGSWP